MSLYIAPRNKVQMGLCEVCDNPTESEVYPMHNGTILMCLTHRDEELEVMTTTAKTVIVESRKQDESVISIGDLLTATTTSLNELRAAINQDASIPDEAKRASYLDEIRRRVVQFKLAIFEHRKEANEIEAVCKVYQVNGQQEAALLHEKERAKYTEFDISYQPTTPKSVKPAKDKVIKPSKPSRGKILLRDANEAGDKYGLPGKAVQAYGESNNLSAEEAAYKLAQMTGKLTN